MANDPPVMTTHGGDRKSDEVKNQGANGTLKRGQNHASYLTARIARDHPEILQRMKKGEFKSVRAAAIEAGIVNVPSNFDIALKSIKRLDRIELIDLQARITEMLKAR